MAEPLKNQFGPDVPRKIAAMIADVHPPFDSDGFIRDTLDGYEALELTPRAWHIAHGLHHFLPQDYPQAIKVLLTSLGPKLEQTDDMGMAPFLYLPHVFFVAEYGLDDFEVSMQAQYELTQRFTAEFSIRAYLETYLEETLERLESWTMDPSPHVRRLVSEGTRPRLPWAPRLKQFQEDPSPVLKLLELLKDDPALYVRRSVANNLNDIGKDHPDILVETAQAWMEDASEERRWLVRHALRSALKRGEPGALAVLGYGDASKLAVENGSIEPRKALIGGSVVIRLEVVNQDDKPRPVMIDARVHYVKANGKTSPKVFKLKTAEIAPQAALKVRKKISLVQMTTRTHYPGKHKVEVVVNGVVRSLGEFELKAE